MKKTGILVLVALFPVCLNGQSDRTGLIKCNIGLSQTMLYHYPDRPLFAIAYTEYYPENKVSIRGEFWARVSDRVEKHSMKNNNSIFLGGLYHLNWGGSDFSIGLLPGISLLLPKTGEEDNRRRVSPSMQICFSYSFYFSKYCHFFFTVNHFNGIYRGGTDGSMNFSGIGFSGGLGFQI